MPRGDSGTSPGLVALTLSESPQSIGIPMSLEDYSFELNRPYLVQIQHYHGLHPWFASRFFIYMYTAVYTCIYQDDEHMHVYTRIRVYTHMSVD